MIKRKKSLKLQTIISKRIDKFYQYPFEKRYAKEKEEGRRGEKRWQSMKHILIRFIQRGWYKANSKKKKEKYMSNF